MKTRNLNAEIAGLRLGLAAPWTQAELAIIAQQAAQRPDAAPAAPPRLAIPAK